MYSEANSSSDVRSPKSYQYKQNLIHAMNTNQSAALMSLSSCSLQFVFHDDGFLKR